MFDTKKLIHSQKSRNFQLQKFLKFLAQNLLAIDSPEKGKQDLKY